MLRLGLLAALLPMLAVSGCSYTSDYRPPNDGRARPLWVDDEVVVSRPTSLPQCAPPPHAYYQGWVPFADGYWDPPEEHGGGAVIVIVGGPPLPVPAGGGSGGGGDSLQGLAGVMAAAIVAFPFVALGLALGQPEPEEEVATAIDAVNTYNDRARYRIAECMAYHQRLRGGR